MNSLAVELLRSKKVKLLRSTLDRLCKRKGEGAKVPLLCFERWQCRSKLRETLGLEDEGWESSSGSSSDEESNDSKVGNSEDQGEVESVRESRDEEKEEGDEAGGPMLFAAADEIAQKLLAPLVVSFEERMGRAPVESEFHELLTQLLEDPEMLRAAAEAADTVAAGVGEGGVEGDLEGDGDGDGEDEDEGKLVAHVVDPLIPSRGESDRGLAKDLARAGIDAGASREIAHEMGKAGAKCARQIARASSARELPPCEATLHKPPRGAGGVIKVFVSSRGIAPPPPQKKGKKRAKKGPRPVYYKLSQQHFQKLSMLHTAAAESGRGGAVGEEGGGGAKGFHRDVARLLARYSAMGGHGYQAALNREAFAVLKKRLGVRAECFASPLNCTLPRYYSAYPDTDACFNSLGNFFGAFRCIEGSFEANPPFLPELMSAMLAQMEALLAAADRADPPAALSFCVVVPEWSAVRCYRDLVGSSYAAATLAVGKGEHGFTDGAQHEIGAESARHRPSSYDTTVCFLQSGAAREKWPVTPEVQRELRAAMARAVPRGSGGQAKSIREYESEHHARRHRAPARKRGQPKGKRKANVAAAAAAAAAVKKNRASKSGPAPAAASKPTKAKVGRRGAAAAAAGARRNSSSSSSSSSGSGRRSKPSALAQGIAAEKGAVAVAASSATAPAPARSKFAKYKEAMKRDREELEKLMKARAPAAPAATAGGKKPKKGGGGGKKKGKGRKRGRASGGGGGGGGTDGQRKQQKKKKRKTTAKGSAVLAEGEAAAAVAATAGPPKKKRKRVTPRRRGPRKSKVRKKAVVAAVVTAPTAATTT